jgi:hypothetical protein
MHLMGVHVISVPLLGVHIIGDQFPIVANTGTSVERAKGRVRYVDRRSL